MTDEPRQPPRLADYRPSDDRPVHPASGRRSVAPAADLGRKGAARGSGGPPPHRRQPPSAAASRVGRPLWQRIAIWSGGGLALLVLVAGAALLALSPAEMIRDRVIAEVRAATGRTLSIDGTPEWSLLGGATVRLGRTTLSSPPGMPGPPVFAADAVEVSAALLPLISGRLSVTHLKLTRPVISLLVDERGRRNWEFAAADIENLRQYRIAQAATGNADGGAPTASDAGRSALDSFRAQSSPTSREAAGLPPRTLAALDRLELGEVRIAAGTVEYRDVAAGRQETVSGIDLSLAGRDVKSPVKARLGLDWRGERITGTADLDSPRTLLAAGSSRVVVSLQSPRGTLSGDGGLVLAGAPRFEGPVKVASPSLGQLAALAGVNLPNAAPLGALEGQGRLVLEPGGARLEQASLWLGGMAASGMIGVSATGGRPTVIVDMALAALDLDRLAAGLGEAAPLGAAAAPAGKPRSIDDLLRGSTAPRELPAAAGAGRFSPETRTEPGAEPRARTPQVRGYTRRLGWSEQPIDAAPLGLVDVKGRLALAGVTAGGIKVGETRVRLSLVAGVLTADVDEIALYEGRGRGRFTANTAAPDAAGVWSGGVAVSGALAVDGLLIGQLLADAGGRPAVEGRARLNLSIEGRGDSEKAIMASLAGRADLRVVDGAVTGWDVGQIVNGLGEGRLPSPAPDPAARTPFSQLSATFALAGGVARTADIRLAGPQLTATGAGAIDVGGRQLDLTIDPRVSPGVVAPGSTINIAKLQVPLRVSGPWEQPAVAIVAGRARIEGQEEMQRRIKEEFKGKSTGEIVNDVLTKGTKSESVDKARRLFREFMKR